MQRLITHLIYSCEKATELLDKRMFEKLSASERIRLFMHTRMCDACRMYEKQTALIHKALNKQASSHDSFPTDLSAFKEKVKENIKD